MPSVALRTSTMILFPSPTAAADSSIDKEKQHVHRTKYQRGRRSAPTTCGEWRAPGVTIAPNTGPGLDADFWHLCSVIDRLFTSYWGALDNKITGHIDALAETVKYHGLSTTHLTYYYLKFPIRS